MKSNSGVYVFGVHASFCYKGKGCGFWIGHPWNGTTILLLRTDREVLPAYESSGCHGPLTYINDVKWKLLLKILKCWGAMLHRLLLTMSSIKKTYILLHGEKVMRDFIFLQGKSYLKFFLLYFIFIATRIMREKEIGDFHNFFSFLYVYFLIIIIPTKILRLKLCHERLNEHFNVTSARI